MSVTGIRELNQRLVSCPNGMLIRERQFLVYVMEPAARAFMKILIKAPTTLGWDACREGTHYTRFTITERPGDPPDNEFRQQWEGELMPVPGVKPLAPPSPPPDPDLARFANLEIDP